MKIRHFAAVATLALLAACSKPAGDAPTAAAPAETAVAVTAPSGVYKLDPAHASLFWTISHLGLSNYTAALTKMDATLNLDAADPAKSSIEVTIDPTSVVTNYPGDFKGTHPQSPYGSFDEEVGKGEGFLNGVKFPTITFKSTAVTKTGARTADVTGDLTFLGVTKPVTLKATFVGDIASHPYTKAGVIGFAAEGKFNRSDFGMAKSPLGDEATIVFNGEFQQQVAAPATAPAA